MGKPLSQEQIAATIKAQAKYPDNLAAASRSLGIGHHSYSVRLQSLENRGIKLAPVTASTVGSAVDEQRAHRKHLDDLVVLRSENKRLSRELNERDEYRASVFGLVAENPPRENIKPPNNAKGGTIDIPVLLASDFQYGETVRADEMDGINAYNPTIAQRRYRYLIQSAISLMTDHIPKPAYPAVYYARLGDAISGRIHDELAETNSLADTECVNDLIGMEADGINELHKAAIRATKQRSVRIEVRSIPGNHGRTTHKPRSKGYVRHNLETLIAWGLEREFKKTSDINFVTPMSGDIYESIYHTPFLFTHGDRIGSRGGTGFIGAAATIMRGIHKTRQQYAGIGKPVRYACLGHFHQHMFLPNAVVNNNLCGFNEYARDLRFEAAPPSQTLFMVHPRWGMTARREIILEDRTADGRSWNNLVDKA